MDQLGFILMYREMQSDGNTFCGDVVLDSFSMEYSDEDSNKSKNILVFKDDWRKCKFKEIQHITTEMSC